MAVVLSLSCQFHAVAYPGNPGFSFRKSLFYQKHSSSFCSSIKTQRRAHLFPIFNQLEKDSADNTQQDDEKNNLGVMAALSVLRFYKREISPLLPKSCRYVPTCSEYSMEAYKKYAVVKGTILTAWRVCRCNPLGGSGFDPPRWFDEPSPPEE